MTLPPIRKRSCLCPCDDSSIHCIWYVCGELQNQPFESSAVPLRFRYYEAKIEGSEKPAAPGLSYLCSVTKAMTNGQKPALTILITSNSSMRQDVHIKLISVHKSDCYLEESHILQFGNVVFFCNIDSIEVGCFPLSFPSDCNSSLLFLHSCYYHTHLTGDS